MPQQAPFRMTPQRAAVLAALRGSHDHPTARRLYERVRDLLPGIGFATVYRTLDLLVRHGHALELQIGEDSVARYDGNTGRHDHARCAGCGLITDVHADLPDEVVVAAGADVGFEVTGYELQLTGRCAGCRQREAGALA